MEQPDIFMRLGIALAIGLLVGLERGWRTRDEEDHRRAAGFRTFALTGLLGGTASLVARETHGLVLGLIFLGHAAAFTLFHWMEAKAEGNFSVTSVVAGLLTFALGALAVLGDVRLAIGGAVAMTGLLALREQLHRWVASLTWPEIRAALTLLAMTFLLLPVLPDRPVDPWSAINPHTIWLLAILMAAISFGGYVAVRALGQRLGVVMTALAGGLASSTATTVTLGRLARAQPQSAGLLSAGILIAGTVMLARVCGIVGLLKLPLLMSLGPPIAAAAALSLAGAGVMLYRNRDDQSPDLVITNPLELGTALKLAAFIAFVLLAAKALLAVMGESGAFLLAALSGIADVDAITITMAQLAGSGVTTEIAAGAILTAVAVNTGVKTMMAASTGGGAIGWRVGAVNGGAALAGLAVYLVLRP